MRQRASAPELVGLAVLGLLITACGHPDQGADPDPQQVDAVAAPAVGACRPLSADDLVMPTNATRTVDCDRAHTAETYAAGDLPAGFADDAYDSAELSRFAYRTCTSQLQDFLDADDSTAMRTLLTWAWFRPSQDAWDQGARWYRCDVVDEAADGPGGTGSSGTGVSTLRRLPTSARGLLAGRPDDRWMACVSGPSVDGAPRTPCSQDHDWRAVTTIKLGEADDPYPGDSRVEARTRSFCSESVSAWLNYPASYDYGFTWFHEAEWAAGNRRSVCWARTTA